MLTTLKRTLLVSAVAAAIAAGTANAQSYVMAGGEPVRTGEGQWLRTGYSAPVAARKPVHYSAEVQFAFDDDVLSMDARKKLDQLAQKLVAMEIEQVVAVGYADRVGPADYNRRLSARRAKAVGDYLGGKGVSGERLQLVAMGAHDSLTAGTCDLPSEAPSDPQRIACLEPDRRVEVKLVGREKGE